MSLTVNQPLQLSAAALGTPGQFDKLIYSYKNLNKQNDKICVIFLWLFKQTQHFTAPNFHWYKDDEELFIRHNLTIEATPDGSQLTILRADPTDGGTYTCTAVNTVGKFL